MTISAQKITIIGRIFCYDNFKKATSRCNKLGHSIIQVKLNGRNSKGKERKINTYYCKECNLYFISRILYNENLDYTINYELVDKVTFPESEKTKAAERKNLNEKEKRIIGIEDFLVRTSLNRCVNKNHSLYGIKACVSIITPKNEIIEESFDATYCSECNKSYIFESTYNRLKRMGHICCKVIEYEDLAQNYSAFSSWQKKSILAMYGYNVNKNESLTDSKRHLILDFVISNDIMHPYEIISHLEMLINTRKNMKNMADACKKWEDDIDYVQHYNKINNSVKVKSIYSRVKV